MPGLNHRIFGRIYPMARWRSKFILLLIVYFAGFATAVYSLAPTPQNTADSGWGAAFDNTKISASSLNSQKLTHSVNIGIHKCIKFAKDAASHASDAIKKEMIDRKDASDN